MNLRKTVLTIATLNFLYFIVEFYFGKRYNSVSLLGDSVDFLEDASVNVLIALAIGWSTRRREQTSYFLAALLLIPGIAFLWNALHQLLTPEVPQGQGMSLVGIGALITNVTCALMIARHQKEAGGLVVAAYYSARNDVVANLLIIAAALYTIKSPSIWPDLIIGIFIFLMNAGAAKEIIEASRNERKEHRS